MIDFKVTARSGQARAGSLATSHGEVLTPAFMPVGTQATVKALSPDELARSGTRLLIANTYHLALRPGAEVVAELGGLHEFMRWPFAIATDSGGYQAFSLASRTVVDEAGFEFSSHLDGSRHLLSPEESMRIQSLLGADIVMQLDICPPAGASRAELELAVARTTRWAKRCLESRDPRQALFGIVQGGLDIELRRSHAAELGALPFDGLALGGFSVGEPPEQMHTALESVVPALDESRPKYLMGVGMPADVIAAVRCGVDLFDCVLPTRNARNGQIFVASGRLNIRNAVYRTDRRPLEDGCSCPTCAEGFSRAYLRHLFIAGEILAHRLLTAHNVCYYQSLLRRAREAILQGSYEYWASERLAALSPEDR